MSVPRCSVALSLLACLWLGGVPAASAAWIWSPETGWVGPSGAVKDRPEEQLAFAMAFFDRKEFDRAEKEFQKLIKAYKDAAEAAEAQYYLGRCAEEERDYYKAFREYRKTIQVYPSTKRFEEILEREYAIGNAFLSGAKRKIFGAAALLPARDKAVEIFEAIAEDGPFSEFGPLAQYKLGLAQLAIEDYEAAVSAFEQVLSRYPESPLVDDARFQIAQASLKGTFKPEYDQAPTDLAIRELEAFLHEYPESDLSGEAAQRLKELQDRRAQHEYHVARFYEQQRHPESARLYYEALIGRFPGSVWASHAAERLQLLSRR